MLGEISREGAFISQNFERFTEPSFVLPVAIMGFILFSVIHRIVGEIEIFAKGTPQTGGDVHHIPLAIRIRPSNGWDALVPVCYYGYCNSWWDRSLHQDEVLQKKQVQAKRKERLYTYKPNVGREKTKTFKPDHI